MEREEQTGPEPGLGQKLFDEAFRFEFFQAVRVLERHFKGREPVGRQVDIRGVGIRPAREVVRFRTRPTLEFPASDLYDITAVPDVADEDSRPARMAVSFMGLIGPSGVLPRYVTEELVDQSVRDGSHALWDFLDLFSHRLISLFYRAWERYRFTVAFERGTYDEFTEYLFDLVGLGTGGLRDRMGLPDAGLLRYAGLISQRPHSAAALEAVVGDYLGVPARIEPFTGQWLELDEENQCRLGPPYRRLGVGTIAGERVWDSQSKFRVVLGPLTLEQFRRLLPEGPDGPAGPDHRPAFEITRLMVGPGLDFDVQLVLRAAEVPDCAADTGAAVRPMLGWTTWLKTRPFERDDSQVILPAAV